jgi:hypothetical protein
LGPYRDEIFEEYVSNPNYEEFNLEYIDVSDWVYYGCRIHQRTNRNVYCSHEV